ncbi:MAG: antitoxin VapB family protein [Candidatus Thermoplasmatota archaeon]|jgi:predicted CopG family antitoxin
MGTKTLSISDDAYQRLRDLKRGNESFSQVIQRLTGRQDLLRFAGSIGTGFANELAATSMDVRSRLDSEWSSRAP